jgi:hypothetical protein
VSETAPTGRWAVRFGRASAAAAASLSLFPNIEIREEHGGEQLLLRGPALDEKLDAMLRQIPGARRFTVADDGSMFPIDSRIPRGKLPADGWSPIARFFGVEPQPAATPGRIGRCVALRIERSKVEDEPNVLITTLEQWAAYAGTAPAVRLKNLRFAASDDGRVILRGSPLPPIAGMRCVERETIVRPCGFAFVPHVEPAIQRLSLDLLDGDLALFAPDGSFEVIPASAFVAATRSAARQTLASSRGSVWP